MSSAKRQTRAQTFSSFAGLREVKIVALFVKIKIIRIILSNCIALSPLYRWSYRPFNMIWLKRFAGTSPDLLRRVLFSRFIFFQTICFFLICSRRLLSGSFSVLILAVHCSKSSKTNWEVLFGRIWGYMTS